MRRVLCLIAVVALAGCTDAMPTHRASETATHHVSRAASTSTSPAPLATHKKPPTGSPRAIATRTPRAPATRAAYRRQRRHSSPAPRSSTALVPTTSGAPLPSPHATLPRGHVPGTPTVVLNPGHNGGNSTHPAEVERLVPSGYGVEKACDTTGTVTNAGYPEHAFNWDVARRAARILRAHGVRVLLTRHSDDGVGPCVNQRAATGNHPWVAAVVSIHADGAPTSGQGFHVIQDSRRPQGATRQVARESRQLGADIHATLSRSSGLVPATYVGEDGYVYRDDLAGLNLARRPATFLELGNMKNPHDAALQSSPRGRQQIAVAIAAGILTFLGSG